MITRLSKVNELKEYIRNNKLNIKLSQKKNNLIKDLEDISIMKINKSIEIKAISKNKGYFKIIPMALQIKDFFLEKNILTLELNEK